MNIYKKENEIIVSLNGCPEGWTTLGFDPAITEDNQNFVTGFLNGKATFDISRINSVNQSRKNSEIDRLKTQIQLYADTLSEIGIEYLGKSFQAKENDLNRMNLALSKVVNGGEFVGAWRSRDNSWKSMTLEEFTALALLAGNHWEGVFKKSRILIDSLGSLNLENLQNYDIEAAWNELP